MNDIEKRSSLRIQFNPLDNTMIPYACQLIIRFDQNTRKINSIDILLY